MTLKKSRQKSHSAKSLALSRPDSSQSRRKTPPPPQKTSASARAKKLTIKQRKFVDGKLKGQSSAEAARKAGYSESVSRSADAIISASPNVKAVIDGILQSAGITDELLGKRMFQGLNAAIVLRETAHAKRELLVNFGERREMVELILRSRGLLAYEHHVKVTVPTLEELLDGSYEERNQV